MRKNMWIILHWNILNLVSLVILKGSRWITLILVASVTPSLRSQELARGSFNFSWINNFLARLQPSSSPSWRTAFSYWLYIPNSIKVALGIGQLRIGKLLFGNHSSKALHCVPYAQMPNAQLPMTNCQSNLYWMRYILEAGPKACLLSINRWFVRYR